LGNTPTEIMRAFGKVYQRRLLPLVCRVRPSADSRPLRRLKTSE
jgi:hypothetical protein